MCTWFLMVALMGIIFTQGQFLSVIPTIETTIQRLRHALFCSWLGRNDLGKSQGTTTKAMQWKRWHGTCCNKGPANELMRIKTYFMF